MLNAADRMYIGAMLRIARMKESVKEMWEEEKGSTSTVIIEIVMVGMVLVLGYIFREKIGELFATMWKKLVVFSDKPDNNVTAETVTNPFSGSGS